MDVHIDVRKDVAQFKLTAQSLVHCVQAVIAKQIELASASSSSSPSSTVTAITASPSLASLLSPQLDYGLMLLLEAKALQRRITSKRDSIEALTAQQKTELDKLNLNLQSVTYERDHLATLVRDTQDFRSTQKPILLQPVDDALRQKLEMLGGGSDGSGGVGEHEFQLLRLQHELQERIRLVQVHAYTQAHSYRQAHSHTSALIYTCS